jgi:hypothetical protein
VAISGGGMCGALCSLSQMLASLDSVTYSGGDYESSSQQWGCALNPIASFDDPRSRNFFLRMYHLTT